MLSCNAQTPQPREHGSQFEAPHRDKVAIPKRHRQASINSHLTV